MEQPELVRKLLAWIDDLQSGMYVNCVYCGHRYGPRETTPATMADLLKEHIERCPDHPMSALKAENERLRDFIKKQADRIYKQSELLTRRATKKDVEEPK